MKILLVWPCSYLLVPREANQRFLQIQTSMVQERGQPKIHVCEGNFDDQPKAGFESLIDADPLGIYWLSCPSSGALALQGSGSPKCRGLRLEIVSACTGIRCALELLWSSWRYPPQRP